MPAPAGHGAAPALSLPWNLGSGPVVGHTYDVPIAGPAATLQEKLEGVRGGIAGASAELQSGLARRQAVAAARALLELMQARHSGGGG